MKKLLVIGIGPGNPEQVTVQAIKAMNTVDVFFVIDKGRDKDDLAQLRRDICDRYIDNRAYRIVEAPDPERDRTPSSYADAVDAWHEQRSLLYERWIAGELADGQCGAFLVWGDPSLYDSTLRIIKRIVARGTTAFDHSVIPGITSIQALAAGHRIALNRIGAPIHITTGRLLSQREPTADSVVMLDGDCAFRTIDDPDTEIFWGAYLGTDKEILIAGRLGDVADEIVRVRAEARAAHGWIMDTYLLRKPPAA